MNAEQMWNEYKKINKNIKDKYEAWAFGVEADLLADLVVRGEKTATASAYPLYEIENEPLPKIGEYSIILNSKNEAICIIKTTKVYIEEFSNISKEHAFKDGEGDKALSYWRKGHEEFFKMCMSEADMEFNENMKVVCEEFKVVYKV